MIVAIWKINFYLYRVNIFRLCIVYSLACSVFHGCILQNVKNFKNKNLIAISWFANFFFKKN